MTFKRHLWLVKQQLLRFEEEQQLDVSASTSPSKSAAARAALAVATAAAAAPPVRSCCPTSDVSSSAAAVPSEFLGFLGRSHPHLLRLKPRLLDKLLEHAVLDLRQQQQQRQSRQQKRHDQGQQSQQEQQKEQPRCLQERGQPRQQQQPRRPQDLEPEGQLQQQEQWRQTAAENEEQPCPKARRLKAAAAARSTTAVVLPDETAATALSVLPAAEATLPAAAATAAAEAATPTVTTGMASAAAARAAVASSRGFSSAVPAAAEVCTAALAAPGAAAATVIVEGGAAATIGDNSGGSMAAARTLPTRDTWQIAAPMRTAGEGMRQSLNSCLNALYSAQAASKQQQQDCQPQQQAVGSIVGDTKERQQRQKQVAQTHQQQQQMEQHQKMTSSQGGVSAAVAADTDGEDCEREAEGIRQQRAVLPLKDKQQQEQEQQWEAAKTSSKALLQQSHRKKQRPNKEGSVHAAAATGGAEFLRKKRKIQQQQSGEEAEEEESRVQQLGSLVDTAAAADAIVSFPPPKDRLRDCVGLPRSLLREIDQKVFLPFALSAFYEERVASHRGTAEKQRQRLKQQQQQDAREKRKEEEVDGTKAEGKKEGREKDARPLRPRQLPQREQQQQQQRDYGQQEPQQRREIQQQHKHERQQQKRLSGDKGESEEEVLPLAEKTAAAQLKAEAAEAADGRMKSEREGPRESLRAGEEGGGEGGAKGGRETRGKGFIQMSRGILISGPAGVGKTKLALAIAGELAALQQQKISFFPASLASLCQRDFSVLPPPWLPQQRPPSGGGSSGEKQIWQRGKPGKNSKRSFGIEGRSICSSEEGDRSNSSSSDDSCTDRVRGNSSRTGSRHGGSNSDDSSSSSSSEGAKGRVGRGDEREEGGERWKRKRRREKREEESGRSCMGRLSRELFSAMLRGSPATAAAARGYGGERSLAAAARGLTGQEGGGERRSGGREGVSSSSSGSGSAEEFLALLFEAAKTQAPAVVLLQDLSLVLQQERIRGAGIGSSKGAAAGRGGAAGEAAADGGGSSGTSFTRALAKELDALYGYDVIVLGVCESAEHLDCGLRRSGRFDTELRLPLPDSASRYQMLQAITRGLPVASDLDFDRMVEATVGYVAADLHALVKEALFYAIVRGLEKKKCSISNNSSSDTGSSSSNSDSRVRGQRRRRSTSSEEADDSNSTSGDNRRIGSLGSSSSRDFLCITTESAKQAETHAAPAIDDERASSGTSPVVVAVGAADSSAAHFRASISSAALSAATPAAVSASACSTDGTAATPTRRDAASALCAPSEPPLPAASPAAVDPAPLESAPSVRPKSDAGSAGVTTDGQHAAAATGTGAAAVAACAGGGAGEGGGDDVVDDWEQWLLSSGYVSIDQAAAEHALLSFVPSYKRSGAFLPRPSVRWPEVGGLCEVKKEVEERILFPLMFPEFYDSMGIRKPTGILLYGPPGCGKTYLAKALANACQANFIAVKGPELLSKYVGESEAALRGVFSRASFYAPCLIFFDEIDAVCGERGRGKGEGGGGNKVEERVVAQLLTELDGISDRGKVFVVAASNRPDILDPALLRPGRLEVRVYVQLPTESEREEILRKGWTRMQREQGEERLKRRVLDDDKSGAFVSDEGVPELPRKADADCQIDFAAIAKITENYSGADLDAVLREAVLLMIQEQRQEFLSAMHKSLNEEGASDDLMGETTWRAHSRREALHENTAYSRLQQVKHSCFYRRAGRMRLQQRHLVAAARRIIPSVTAEQVQFYERYRQKLAAEQKSRVILDT